MRIHILGICGTFMGSLALLARELGHTVSGVDQQVYPPMSDQLHAADIELYEGYDNHALDSIDVDIVVVGNAMSRGNPAIEYLLDNRLPYTSGPDWLAKHVLGDCHVLAVAGTHGKTTTSSMLAWILEYAGLKPGFLIGGVPQNFGVSARAGESVNGKRYFVVEADEYDTAFFDKRAKFVHYRPSTLVLNNLEFDHADIYPDLAAIQRQFHHVVRTVPQNGAVLLPSEPALQAVIDQGCWSALHWLSGCDSHWRVFDVANDQSAFSLAHKKTGSADEESATIRWSLCGMHNLHNALAAVAASAQVGVSLATAAAALEQYVNVKRRLELLDTVNGINVFDDFAHHPTAIASTLNGVKQRYPDSRIHAVLEPRSNTMKMGVHNAVLATAVDQADFAYWFTEDVDADLCAMLNPQQSDTVITEDRLDALVNAVAARAEPGDAIVVMSNGGFQGVHQKLLAKLRQSN